jgi:hypothetical protein
MHLSKSYSNSKAPEIIILFFFIDSLCVTVLMSNANCKDQLTWNSPTLGDLYFLSPAQNETLAAGPLIYSALVVLLCAVTRRLGQ